MKKTMMAIILCLMSITMFGQLNSYASSIKNNHPTLYQNTIRTFGVNEWGTDYEMVVYTINNQAEALYNIVSLFQSNNTQILYDAMVDWSWDGKEYDTRAKFQKLKAISVANLLSFYCDWEMVEYTYKNQVKAKGSF